MLRSHSPAAAQLMQSGFSSWQTADAALLQKAMRAEMPTRKQTVIRIEKEFCSGFVGRGIGTRVFLSVSANLFRDETQGFDTSRWFSFCELVFFVFTMRVVHSVKGLRTTLLGQQ